MEYQVIARKYRPKSFKEVLGQEAIVTTLRNAIRQQRLAQAYLFCGSRGTGKTTLARVFAKSLNCLQPGDDFEPCNQCSSCKEIATGRSLDVLEIDGASNRGIEDIRKINETVGYATASGKYKIYIIDEVHMLTKEAFNALLKTLEEPPAKVKFFFATTEPHKVLPTILSRCQRFNLRRIPTETIVNKLRTIAKDLNVEVEDEALHIVATRADGGLRDAESLFDQVISFHEGAISAESVGSVLGVLPREVYFKLDTAGKAGDLTIAFEIAFQVFSEGKDLGHFVEGLVDHYRTLLLVKLAGKEAPYLSLSDADRQKYEEASKLYSREQCQTILDFLIEAESKIRFQPSPRIALEALLMRIVRSHTRVPVEVIVKKLAELEQKGPSQVVTPPPVAPAVVIEKAPAPVPPPVVKVEKAPVPPKKTISEDPTPSPADLGIKVSTKKPEPKPVTPEQPLDRKKQSQYDTILQFAAIELNGNLEIKKDG